MSEEINVVEERKKRIEQFGYEIPTENEIEFKKIQLCRDAFLNFIGFLHKKLVIDTIERLEHGDFKTLGLSHFTITEYIRYCQERNLIVVIKDRHGISCVRLEIEYGKSKLEKWAFFCRKKMLGENFNFTDFENYGKDKKNKKLGEFVEREEG
jgi:hypothetical protein